MIAAVIVDIAHANVDRIFEYALPQGLPVSPGQRVLVPFGKGDRPTEVRGALERSARPHGRLLKNRAAHVRALPRAHHRAAFALRMAA